MTDKGISFSRDPDLINPQLSLNSYYGDLGLDKGSPQNVFELDVKDLKPLNSRDLKAGGITLGPGNTYTLPDGKGSITFDGVKKYVGVDIHHNPGQLSALIFALLAVAGLVVSLYVNRRRVWVRTGTHEDGRTMVEYGLLARGETTGWPAKRLRSAGCWQRRGAWTPRNLPANWRIMARRAPGRWMPRPTAPTPPRQ